MTTTHNIKTYPGMIDSNYEFFKSSGGLKVISSGTVLKFKDISMPLYQLLKERMKAEPDAMNILRSWFPNSELCQLEKFAECRFGGLDFTPDISESEIQDGEYWDCPLRGNCKGEGIVCKNLSFQGQVLTVFEIKMMRLVATNYTNEVIAELLEISFGQLHKLKQALYQKLNVQTKQEVTLIAGSLNLI
jgi:DNA-binding CsgD family transcriptional regulator